MIQSWMDIAIEGIVGLSVFTGLMRGFVKELIALVAWVLAIWIAFEYMDVISLWLQPYLHDKTIRAICAFFAILIAVLVSGSLVNACLSFLLKHSGLSGTDRILGMGFGLVRGVLIVAIIMVVIALTQMPIQPYAQESRLYPYFSPVVAWLAERVQPIIARAQAMESEFIEKKKG